MRELAAMETKLGEQEYDASLPQVNERLQNRHMCVVSVYERKALCSVLLVRECEHNETLHMFRLGGSRLTRISWRLRLHLSNCDQDESKAREKSENGETDELFEDQGGRFGETRF